MNRAADSLFEDASLVSWRHLSAEEYSGWLHQRLSSAASIDTYLNDRASFVKMYPDLNQWLQKPLPERLGRLWREKRPTLSYKVSYKARPYLYFLVIRGCLLLDWEWLIAVGHLEVWPLFEQANIDMGLPQLLEEAVKLGYVEFNARLSLKWALCRLFMHTGKTTATDLDRQELVEAVLNFKQHSDLLLFFGSKEHYHDFIKGAGTNLHLLQAALYHLGRAESPPRKRGVPNKLKMVIKPRMEAVLLRYREIRGLTDRPATLVALDLALRQFGVWLERNYPDIASFAQVNRQHALEYIQAIQTLPNELNGKPLSAYTKRGRTSCLAVFFRDVAEWHWEDVPSRPLLGRSDLPKMPQRVPRYIPEEELGRLMKAIEALQCPYQKAALLIARWSGARKDEIRRLSFDCLDSYPDGTPRLRIPVGKTKKERVVPLHEEAAAAIRAIQAGRPAERGLPDSYTGVETCYLFLRHGKLYSSYYLFFTSLHKTCQAAGLLDSQGRATISAHRFRHTVGTQLAEKGAKLSTIMSVLGHASASMSMVYAQISDREVLKDYQSVLGPGATIAGPAAAFLQNMELKGSEINWLQTNFFKTELELGHCLRLPQEGPCECELYLNCTKFVTTKEYAPRLRHRRKLELELIQDAHAQGWQREVERHTCSVKRLEQLLNELGESLEGPPPAE